MRRYILAYFFAVADAEKTAAALLEKGYEVKLDRIEGRVPDPEFSVSELMVGFLPDLAHGIFGRTRPESDSSEERNKGAFLLVLTDEKHNSQEARDIIEKFGGEVDEEQ